MSIGIASLVHKHFYTLLVGLHFNAIPSQCLDKIPFMYEMFYLRFFFLSKYEKFFTGFPFHPFVLSPESHNRALSSKLRLPFLSKICISTISKICISTMDWIWISTEYIILLHTFPPTLCFCLYGNSTRLQVELSDGLIPSHSYRAIIDCMKNL